ncbi:hypothetical protein MM236_14855 [Belliella sp. DSM 107340]|uniref:Uncharacterized protein n=1 Tax=Belliella calami TaxID=2923436 RepID=A0ABS9US55_9BACT|nr:hypothetical protein [Belliella calami]
MRIIKQILVSLLVVSVLVGGYFFYHSSYWKGEKNALEIVSPDAIFVFETQEPVMAWNQLVSQPIWNRLTELPSVKNAESQLVSLDSLVGRSGNLDRSLKGNQFVASLHAVGRDEFDFLFTLSFKNGSDQEFISSLEKNLPDLSQITRRSYSQIPVYELQNVNLERNLTYAKIENIIVASYTSFLVEEAIRLYQNSSEPNFKSVNKELFEKLPMAKGLGVFRLASSGLSKLVAGISRNENLNLVTQFAKNGLSGNFELNFSEGKISLKGATFFQKGLEVDFTKGNRGIKEVSNFIPNRTSVLFRYNLESAAQLAAFTNEDFQAKSTVSGEIEKNLIQKDFLKKLTGDLTFMIFETPANQEEDKVMLIQTDGLDAQLSLLKNFNDGVGNEAPSSELLDVYQGKEIFVIATEDFPAHLFDGKFRGFSETYITGFDGMLVFANNIKSLRVFLDDIAADNTWGKSLQQKRIAGTLDSTSGFNFVINVPRMWSGLENISSPNWKVFLQKYAPQLKSLDILSIGVVEGGDVHKTNIDFSYSLRPIKAVSGVVLTENKVVRFRDNLIYGPKAIQNFNDRSAEFVVQDENNQVHLLTGEGEIVFSQALDGVIISDIFQVDFYKNGKLQLLFATQKMIYIIDRLGGILPNYPLEIAGRNITHLNLVDYDNNRDYRFFVGTDQAELYLINKNGDALEGWDPQVISSNLVVKPAHHRIAGAGDQMLALNTQGDLYFFNRRGEKVLDSPIKIGGSLNSDYIIVQRGSASSSRLVTVTEDGEVVNINFRGEMGYRNQLMRPDKESQFYLVKDQKEDRFVLVVHEFNKITIMNTEYEELFSYNIFSEELEFQFFSFGSDKNIFVVIDPIQQFTYLFSLNGELLNSLPISTKNQIEVKYSSSQNEYRIYVISENEFVEYRLPI